jgi:hypothetical protein
MIKIRVLLRDKSLRVFHLSSQSIKNRLLLRIIVLNRNLAVLNYLRIKIILNWNLATLIYLRRKILIWNLAIY